MQSCLAASSTRYSFGRSVADTACAALAVGNIAASCSTCSGEAERIKVPSASEMGSLLLITLIV